jgi:hypothetical protein
MGICLTIKIIYLKCTAHIILNTNVAMNNMIAKLSFPANKATTPLRPIAAGPDPADNPDIINNMSKMYINIS